jgi:hypothetical protein
MNIERITELAHKASEIVATIGNRWDDPNFDNGEFVSLYNHKTGQSSVVLRHLPSNYVFKADCYNTLPSTNASRRNLGEVTIHGSTYRVRLPEFYIIEMGEDTYGDPMTMVVTEFVDGDDCGCDAGGWCVCARAMSRVTNCNDTHSGNWLIKDDEVILFDFEGINLTD